MENTASWYDGEYSMGVPPHLLSQSFLTQNFLALSVVHVGIVGWLIISFRVLRLHIIKYCENKFDIYIKDNKMYILKSDQATYKIRIQG